MFLKSLYQQKIIKNYQNFLEENLKDQFIGVNMKQKGKIKIQQFNINISLNQTLLELTDRFFLVYLKRANDVTRFKDQRCY